MFEGKQMPPNFLTISENIGVIMIYNIVEIVSRHGKIILIELVN